MKKSITSTAFIVLSVLAIVGLGANAFADWGMGYGQRGWGHRGPGMYPGGSGGPECGYMIGNLSDDEIQQMDEQRKAFFKTTEDLRQKIYEKELALQSEFAKEKPDAKKAATLQKEISEFQAQIDQKRIGHMVEMRKINPNAGRRYTGRGGMGYGRSFGGYCWR